MSSSTLSDDFLSDNHLETNFMNSFNLNQDAQFKEYIIKHSSEYHQIILLNLIKLVI